MQSLYLLLALNWVGLVSCTLTVTCNGTPGGRQCAFRKLRSYVAGKPSGNAQKLVGTKRPIMESDFEWEDLSFQKGKEAPRTGSRKDADRAYRRKNPPAGRSNVPTDQGRGTSLLQNLGMRKSKPSRHLKTSLRQCQRSARTQSSAGARRTYIKRFRDYARALGGDLDEEEEEQKVKAAPMQSRKSAGGQENPPFTGGYGQTRNLSDVTVSDGKGEEDPPQKGTRPVTTTRTEIQTGTGPTPDAECVGVSERSQAAETPREGESILLGSVSAGAAATPVAKPVEGSVAPAKGGGDGLPALAIKRDGNSADPRKTSAESTECLQGNTQSNQRLVEGGATPTSLRRANLAQGGYKSGDNSGRDGKSLSREERVDEQRLQLETILAPLLNTPGARVYILQTPGDEAGRTGRVARKVQHSDSKTNETRQTRIHGSASTCAAAGREYDSKVSQGVEALTEGEDGYQRANAEGAGEGGIDLSRRARDLSGEAEGTPVKVLLATLMEAILEKAATVLCTLEQSGDGVTGGGSEAKQEISTDGGSNTAETADTVEGGRQQAGDAVTSSTGVNDADRNYRGVCGEDCRKDSGGSHGERVPGDGSEKEEEIKEIGVEKGGQTAVGGAKGPRKAAGRRLRTKCRRHCIKNEVDLASLYPTPPSSSESTEKKGDEKSTALTSRPAGSEQSSRSRRPESGTAACFRHDSSGDAPPGLKDIVHVQVGLARAAYQEPDVAAAVPSVDVQGDASEQRGDFQGLSCVPDIPRCEPAKATGEYQLRSHNK